MYDEVQIYLKRGAKHEYPYFVQENFRGLGHSTRIRGAKFSRLRLIRQSNNSKSGDLISEVILCGPLRISAISAFNGYFNAEDAEIRRVPQRKSKLGRRHSKGLSEVGCLDSLRFIETTFHIFRELP